MALRLTLFPVLERDGMNVAVRIESVSVADPPVLLVFCWEVATPIVFLPREATLRVCYACFEGGALWIFEIWWI